MFRRPFPDPRSRQKSSQADTRSPIRVRFDLAQANLFHFYISPRRTSFTALVLHRVADLTARNGHRRDLMVCHANMRAMLSRLIGFHRKFPLFTVSFASKSWSEAREVETERAYRYA